MGGIGNLKHDMAINSKTTLKSLPLANCISKYIDYKQNRDRTSTWKWGWYFKSMKKKEKDKYLISKLKIWED